MLEERFRMEYDRLPYLLLPIQMIRELLAKITFNQYLVIPKGRCSEHYSPNQILKTKNVDYQKELKYGFVSSGVLK